MSRRSTAVILISLLAGHAEAATMENFRVNQWFAGSYSNDSTKKFSHCAAAASYNSGVSMLFTINRNYFWSLGFAHPAWDLTPGAKFPIQFTVDGSAPLSGQAVAISKEA